MLEFTNWIESSTNWFSPHLWFKNSSLSRKNTLHSTQFFALRLCSFSKWTFNECDCANELPQRLHTNNFSRVCVLTWIRKCLAEMKVLVQTSHLYGLVSTDKNKLIYKSDYWMGDYSPVWLIMCSIKWARDVRFLPQNWQLLSSTSWIPEWFFKSSKITLHIPHHLSLSSL